MTFEDKVIGWVKQVPAGKVATYGQIAALAGSPRGARMVGWILAKSDDKLPWRRVINSKGQISIVNMEYPAQIQAAMLEDEGVKVEKRGEEYFVDLKRYLWEPVDDTRVSDRLKS